jgi:hypothetical protein
MRVDPLPMKNITVKLGAVIVARPFQCNARLANPFEFFLAFHSIYFDVVAPPGKTVAVSFARVERFLGDFSRSIPVTTNLTAPFFLHLAGSTEKSKLRLVDGSGRVLRTLNFTDVRRKWGYVWKRTIFVENSGRIMEEVTEFNISSRFFSVAPKCPKSLAPGERCRVVVWLDASRMAAPVESAPLTLEEHTMVLWATVEAEFWKQLVFVKSIVRVVVYAILFSPGFRFLWLVIAQFRAWGSMKWREKRWEGAANRKIRKLLPAVAVQVYITDGRCPGAWISAPNNRRPVRRETVAQMELFLSRLR